MFDRILSRVGLGAEEPIYLWVTNRGAANITMNSIASARRCGIGEREQLIVAVLDDEAGQTITAMDDAIEVLRMSDIEDWRRLGLAAAQDYRAFNSREFGIAALARYLAIDHLLATRKRPVIYTDGDIVYLRNPSRYLNQLQSRSRSLVLVQNDRVAGDCGPGWQAQYDAGELPFRSQICTGFMVWQPIQIHRDMAQAIIGSIVCEGNWPVDQGVVNRLDKRWLRHVKLLRQDLFPNGSIWLPDQFTSHTKAGRPDFDCSTAYILHANFVIGIDLKVAALKHMNQWHLEHDMAVTGQLT